MHAIPAHIGKKIKPTQVIDRVREIDVAPIIIILSTDSNIVFRGLYFLYSFFDMQFLSSNYEIISSMDVVN